MSLEKIVYLVTNGCPENGLDLARMRELLRREGHSFTNDPKLADLILFNGCGLTQYAEDESIKIINQLKAIKKSSAEFISYGCISEINKERLRQVYKGPTFGSDEIEEIQTVFKTINDPNQICANYIIKSIHNISSERWRLPNLKKIGSLMEIEKYFLMRKYQKQNRIINPIQPYAYIIKISTGCLSNCAFCAVRLSRGAVKSKSIDMVISEFKKGLSKGYKDFALIGTDLGSYGRDHGNTLVSLLKELIKVKGDYQIWLRNIQPRFLKEMMDDLEPVFDSGKVVYVGTAVESGNNRILKRMKRGYTSEDYKKIIQTLNQNYPNIFIRTQLIAGFPGETEKEFEDTLRLFEEVKFDFAEAYLFEGRQNTIAFDMSGQVLSKIKEERYFRLLKKSVNNQLKRKYHCLKLHEKKLKTYTVPDLANG
jgi:MiaB/RimO family radical SAM methylthiotransferase